MSWMFSNRLSVSSNFLRPMERTLYFLVALIAVLSFSGCGRIYFPIELKTVSRSDRSEKQEDSNVVIIPMTAKNIKLANSGPYNRYIIEAGDLEKPAKLVPSEAALVEKIPSFNDPGPYLLGIGDVIGYEEAIDISNTQASRVARELIVNEDGLINFFQLGRIKAEGKTLSELEDLIYKKVVETGGNTKFNLFIRHFRSKYVSLSYEGTTTLIPYISTPMFIENVLGGTFLPELGRALAPIKVAANIDNRILIYRGDDKFVVSYKSLMKNRQKQIRIFPGDRIAVEPLRYKVEKVLLVGETGAQRAIPIDSGLRPSLSDTLFSGSVLNNITSDFSQIYVLRKQKKLFQAFHLDITDPTRVSLSNLFEMRPDDIVFVATQPLSLYSRTLSQILGSTGLTLQARDIIRTEIGD